MNKRNSNDNPWKAVALVSAIGADLVVCMGAGYWLGKYLSGWLGHTIWIVAGIMTGFIVGVISVIFLIRHYTEGTNG
jgi:predicted membrane-bound spermidine synthase